MPSFKAWINPLKCPEIDFSPDGEVPTAEQLFDYVCAPELGRAAFVSRYREVASIDTLFLAPNERRILEKLVWPLRNAKGSYALGNYLGCIALCGMVGEMVAVLVWDISKVSLQNRPMDESAQKNLLGATFEKLGQERRTRVLRALGLITEEVADVFDGLRGIRNKYLHVFSQPHGELADHAKVAYKHASKLVETIIGAKVSENGTAVLREDLAKYLTERNVF